MSFRVCAIPTVDVKQEGHSPLCWDLAIFFLACTWGMVKNETVCGLGGDREFLRGSALSLGRAVTVPGPARSAAPGKPGAGPPPLLSPSALDAGRLVGILVKFLGNGFLCCLYFLTGTSVSLFTSIALVLSSCFLPFQTINFIFFIRIQSTQGY